MDLNQAIFRAQMNPNGFAWREGFSDWLPIKEIPELKRILQPGEIIHVDTGCVAAFEPTVDFEIQRAGGVKTMLFGGEGFFFAIMQGPGRSLPRTIFFFPGPFPSLPR